MADRPSVRVEEVPLAATADLRRRVLRPTARPDEPTWSSVPVPGSATFAVLLGAGAGAAASSGTAGEPVVTVTVMPEPCPWRAGAAAPWRLRGMATAEGWRGRGIGRLALDAAVDHVTRAGADLLWCNARLAAVPFYERAGFVVEGPEFDVVGIGPHRPLALPRSARPGGPDHEVPG